MAPSRPGETAFGGPPAPALEDPSGGGSFQGSPSNSLAQSVQTVALESAAGGLTNLAVGGTSGNDSFIFSPGSKLGDIIVVENLKPRGTFHPTGQVLIFGGGGTDSVTVSGGSMPDSYTIDPKDIVLDGVTYVGNGISKWYAIGGPGSDTALSLVIIRGSP